MRIDRLVAENDALQFSIMVDRSEKILSRKSPIVSRGNRFPRESDQQLFQLTHTHFINPSSIHSTNIEPIHSPITMATRSQLSKNIEKEVFAYVKANPLDGEWCNLPTPAEKAVKALDRPAEDLSLKIGKFSTEVDLNRELSPTTRNTKRKMFKRIMDRIKTRLQWEVEAAAARFHPDPAVLQHHYHPSPLPVTPYRHPYQYGNPHGITPVLHPTSRQAPATAASAQGVGESLAPTKLFEAASQSQAKSNAIQAKSDAIVQSLAESVQKTAESLSMEVKMRVDLKNQVEKQGESIQTLADTLVMERGFRIDLQNQVEQQGVSILQGQGDIRQLQTVQAQGVADFQGLRKKVDEEAADKEELKNVVNEMKTKIEVLTLTSQKQKKSMTWEQPAHLKHSCEKVQKDLG